MITREEAFSFLKEHQPMPSDIKLRKEEIEKYDEVRRFFLDNVDEQCIPLFLNSFGGKDGFGIYQMVDDVITMYDKEVVLPYIINAFNSSSENIIYWCIQIASNFPDEDLFNPMVKFLQYDDEDIKLATITTLAQLALNNIRTNDVLNILKDETDRTFDEEIKEFIEEVLEDIKNSGHQ